MTDDNVDSLRQEVGLMGHPGWELRRNRIMARLEQEGRGLILGTVIDDRERERCIGRCQAFKEMLDIDTSLQEAWKQIQEEEHADGEGKEEGADLGIHYDAAQ